MNNDTRPNTGWDLVRGAVRTRWTRLGEKDLDAIDGRRDALLERIAATYGISREEAESQLVEWEHTSVRDVTPEPPLTPAEGSSSGMTSVGKLT